jgi:tetratricopeptide (TPR) repeat protein
VTTRGANRGKTRRDRKPAAATLAGPAAGWLSRALEAQKAARLGEAEELCRQALAHNPAHPDACYLLAQNLRQRGELREAATMAARAASGRPAEPVFHLWLGDVLQARNERQAALLCYSQALALQPDLVPALVNLGNALERMGPYREAQVSYGRAIQLHPRCAEAYDNLGNALRAEGRAEEALACHAEALRLEPGYSRALVNMAASFPRRFRRRESGGGDGGFGLGGIGRFDARPPGRRTGTAVPGPAAVRSGLAVEAGGRGQRLVSPCGCSAKRSHGIDRRRSRSWPRLCAHGRFKQNGPGPI